MRFHDSLVGGFGRVISFNGFGAEPLFSDEFDGETEEVEEEPPFFGREVVERRDEFFHI